MRRATASPPVSNPPPVTARSIREHGELGGGGSGLRGCSVGGGGSRPTHDGIREGGRAACRLSARASDAASAGSLPAASGLRATALGDTVRPSESRLICHTWVPLSSPEGCSGRGPISLRAARPFAPSVRGRGGARGPIRSRAAGSEYGATTSTYSPSRFVRRRVLHLNSPRFCP